MFTLGHRLLNGTLVAALVLAAAPAFVQQASAGEGIGIVTGIQGQATVSRVALPQPAALRFKDDVFFRDQIATRERSTVRLLLGGKGTLTVREQSQVTLDEAVTPDGGRRSVIGLLAGKIGAAIAHALMRPGESVEIQTPNAVAAVRGTVLIAEYIPPQGSAAASPPILLASVAPGPFLAQAAGAGGTSNFFVLSGQVTITPQGQSPLTLGPLQAVSVTATPGGVQAGAVRNITPAEAAEAAQGLETGKPHTGEAEGGKTAQAQAEVAAAIANVILEATGQPTTTTVTAPPTPTNTVTPVVAQPPPLAIIGENVLPAGPLLSLDNVTLGLATGTSLATFSAGAANAVTPLAIGGGGVAVLTAPLLEATGTPITHDGAIVTLDNAAAIVGASEDTTTPLVKIDGTALTNTGGAVFNLSGGSVLTTFGPVLALQAEGSATLAGVMSIGGGSVVALGSADALVIPSGSSLTATAPLYTVAGGSTLGTFGGGALVAMDPSTLTLSAPIVSATGSTVALAGPALRAVDSTITGTQPLVLLQSGSTLGSLGGPVLDLTNSTLDLGSQPVVKLLGGSTFATDVGPVIRVSGGSLTADSLGSTDGNGNTWNLTGTLLDLTNATVQLRKLGGGPESNTDIATFSLAAGEPTISMSNSSLTLTGVGEKLLPLVPTGTTPVGGLGLIASGSTITLAGPLLSLDGVALTATDPYIQLTNSTVSQTGSNSLIEAVSNSPVTVAGPLLSATGSTLSTGATVFHVGSGSQFTSTAPDALLQLSGGSVSTAGPFALVDGGAAMTLPGSLLSASSGSSLSVGGSALSVTGGSGVDVGSGPVVSLSNSFLSVGGDLVSFTAGSSVQFSGSVLVLDAHSGSTVALGGSVLNVTGESELEVGSSGPVVSLNSSSLTAGGNLVSFTRDSTGYTWSYFNGGVLDASNGSAVSVGGSVVNVSGGVNYFDSSDYSAGGTAVSLSNSSLTAGGSLISVTNGYGQFNGTALTASSSTVTVGGNVIDVSNSSFGINTAPAVSLSNSSLTAGGSLVNFTGGSCCGFNGGGTVLDASSGSTVTLGGSVLNVAGESSLEIGSGPAVSLNNSSLKAGGSLVQLSSNSYLGLSGPALTASNSTVNVAGNLISLSSGATGNAPGTILDSAGSTITVGGSVFSVQGQSNATMGGGPFVQLSGSSLTADSFFASDGSGNTVSETGTFLDLSNNAAVTVRAIGNKPSPTLDTSTQTLGATEPWINMSASSLTVTGAGYPLLDPGTPTQTTANGLGLVATSGSTITLAGPLLNLDGVTLTATDPYVQLSNSTVTQTGANSLIEAVHPSSVTIAGPLLSASNSTFTTGANLLQVSGGSTLRYTPALEAPPALLQFSGSTINAGSLLFLGGVTTDDSGLGTDIPLTTGGTILELDSSSTVNLSGTGNAINVDTATLNAVAPIINMVNSSLTTSSAGTGLMSVSQSYVNTSSAYPVFQLNNSILTVQNGPLLSVTGGSQMTVNGDFAYLTSGSKIWVQNGPLIYVDGINAQGSPSTLTIKGALVNFGDSTANQVIIKNTISPNAFPSGIPVSQCVTCSISIPGYPINGSPGIVTVNGATVTPGGSTYTGSVIQATNGGKVTFPAR